MRRHFADVATEPVASLRTKEYDALRALLREVRESAGISQETLSQRLGRPITYVGKVELGSRRLDVVEMISICLALNVDPVEIVGKLRDYMSGSADASRRP